MAFLQGMASGVAKRFGVPWSSQEHLASDIPRSIPHPKARKVSLSLVGLHAAQSIGFICHAWLMTTISTLRTKTHTNTHLRLSHLEHPVSPHKFLPSLHMVVTLHILRRAAVRGGVFPATLEELPVHQVAVDVLPRQGHRAELLEVEVQDMPQWKPKTCQDELPYPGMDETPGGLYPWIQ